MVETPVFVDREAVRAALEAQGYLADGALTTAIFLAQALGQPLLLEGEPGVGKTSAAQAIARSVGSELIRLQCYEGISAGEALYEWNYPRQLLAVRTAESRGAALEDDDLFTERFLVDRPLLRAVRWSGPAPAVVLLDEVDRADHEFEALLYEFLGENSVTVPELGTFRARRAPIVILTSNRTRELHDALKRRCLYHWIAYPSVARAAAIVRRNVPSSADALVTAATAFVARVRDTDLDKPPGLAETIDWVGALGALGVAALDEATAIETLGTLAKTPDDLETLQRLVTEGVGG
ncbi:MAG: MoxR family ATPase [Nitriliruptor sp.]|uniref:AAA family ATPase n=1 Tax=Nitriliruptor sp. TaxID=2448056 RepID=UPI0034A0A29B